jgi:hypothetical protein
MPNQSLPRNQKAAKVVFQADSVNVQDRATASFFSARSSSSATSRREKRGRKKCRSFFCASNLEENY